LIRNSVFIALSIRGLGDRNVIPIDSRKRASALVRSYDRQLAEARNGLDSRGLEDPKLCRARAFDDIPDEFIRAIDADGIAHVDLGEIPKGRAYAYATGPIERAQRISALASASNVAALSLSLGAALPTRGLSLNQAMEFMHKAIGSVESRERHPIVAGFSTRSEIIYQKDLTQFGWIFGPPVRIDTRLVA
jgi:hypothetical protein